MGSVWEAREVAQGPMGRRKDTEAVLGDETGNIRVIWFGQRYLARTLKPGSKLAVSGKASVFRGQLVFESPEYEPVQPDQPGTHTGRLVPILSPYGGHHRPEYAPPHLAGIATVVGRS